jgi:hypothetical protein
MSERTVEAGDPKSVGIAPFAFQHYAKDFFTAYSNHPTEDRFSPARFFLLTRSIELAAKALHLAQGRSLDDVLAINHDLEAACSPEALRTFGIHVSDTELAELRKANRYYKGKGFEYFLFKFPGVAIGRSGPQQALSGWPDLPDEQPLRHLFHKLVAPKL